MNEYVLYKDENDGKLYFSIKLADWIYSSILYPGCKEILTLDQDYYKIENGLKRRIYEIIRQKMGMFSTNGNKPRASADMTIAELQALTGSTIARSSDFKATVKRIFKDEINATNEPVRNGFAFKLFHWKVVICGDRVKLINQARINDIKNGPSKEAFKAIRHSLSD